MKKLLTLVLASLLLITNVFAAADIPEFMQKEYNNYTASYKISMTFDNADSIVAFLEEVEMPKQIEYFVDLKTLLKTLLSYDGEMLLQADVSEDFKKIKLALTTEEKYYIEPNSNLDITINAKEGLWLDIDLTKDGSEVFEIIVISPIQNKYLKMDLIPYFAKEDMDMIKSIFNKEYIESMSKPLVESLYKYVKFEGSGSKYTMTLDNEGFSQYCADLFGMMAQISASSQEMTQGDAQMMAAYTEIFKNMKFLGDDGMVCDFTLDGNNISYESSRVDFEMDISKMVELMTGQAWQYQNRLSLDFTLSVGCDISKVGSTTVEFPVLTEENSFTLEDVMPTTTPDDNYDGIYEDDEYSEPEYPNWYIGETCDYLPVVNGQIYVPLRQTLEAAYDVNVTIGYNKGVINASSEYFPGGQNLKMTVGESTVYFGEFPFEAGEILLVGGTTYVPAKLFCEGFGWELAYAGYSLIDGCYYYEFYTM